MSVITPPPQLNWPAMSPYPVHRFSVDDYHRMIQAGILTEDDRVELLEGVIVPKMPHNPPHDGTIQLANKRIGRRLPAGWDIRVQSAITTPDSEPEPDLAIVRGDESTYLHRHPEPPDIGIVIEVADATLTTDRRDKGRLYARAGILCYWIINLVDRKVEVYTDPTGPDANPRFRQHQDYDLQAAVPLVIDGQERGPIPVPELLP
jgi:Uma2 family endonuclease